MPGPDGTSTDRALEWAVGVLVIVVLALGGAIAFRASSQGDAPREPVADPPQLAARVDPSPSAPEPRLIEDAGREGPAPDDAGEAVAPEPVDAGLLVAVQDPPVVPAPTRPPVKGRGKLTLKTRPRATVYLNGRRIGETPLVKLSVPAGLLKLRLVRADTRDEQWLEVEILPNRTTVQNFTFPAS